MKKVRFLVQLFVLMVTFSCNNSEIEEFSQDSDMLPQVYIDQFSVREVAQTRSGPTASVREIQSHDLVSDANIDFYFVEYSESKFGVDINKDGFIDMALTVQGDMICGNIGNIYHSVIISTKVINGVEVFTFTPVTTTETTTATTTTAATRGGYYYHMSWWECVYTLGSNANLYLPVTVLGHFYKPLPVCIATLASILCLVDDRLRWIYKEEYVSASDYMTAKVDQTTTNQSTTTSQEATTSQEINTAPALYLDGCLIEPISEPKTEAEAIFGQQILIP